MCRQQYPRRYQDVPASPTIIEELSTDEDLPALLSEEEETQLPLKKRRIVKKNQETHSGGAHRRRSVGLRVVCLKNQSINRIIQVLIESPVALMTRDVLCQMPSSVLTEIYSHLKLRFKQIKGYRANDVVA